jgi:hypothetical protein
MPLLALWKSDPVSVGEFSIEQVVAAAGNGELKDGSVCSQELCAFLAQVPTPKLAEYIERCLSISFARSGMVLQDLVNELGRRLDYTVENGRYQGTTNAVGFDGMWQSPEGHSLIIEVKTTDAYRISLDTIAAYRERLRASGRISHPSSMLIVVGRDDTDELEAQVRGSRHAWDIRLISSEALLKLVQLKENAEEPETGLKIRSLLTPMEYTRLDQLIDVMFATATDIEPTIVTAAEPGGDGEDLDQEDMAGRGPVDQPPRTAGKGTWEFTDSAYLQLKRADIIAALSARLGAALIKRTRALYWDAGHDLRVACSISKRYTKRGSYPYLYAYHPQWDEFLREGRDGFFVLGCMDLSVAFSIPWRVLNPLLPALNTTTTDRGTYWHVHIAENAPGTYSLLLPKEGRSLPLAEFALSLRSPELLAVEATA